ncbi:MAG: L-iditol 2-dehydrogenase [Gaiellales bacterium]|jgi:L-iditol 2-dehydrogenase|nr:L-iditol 2-dehydrogenase [Gaiellales bacterium]
MTEREQMRALLLDAERHLALVDLPLPLLERPDDVLVRVHAVGVCGSDLHGYLGVTGRRVPPLVMGHEATGEVVAAGAGVRHLHPGARVATNTIAACGHCRPCLAGGRSLCENRRILGMSAPGAYAEYVVWPEDSLPELPDGLSYEAGALAEPLAVALHAINIAAIKPGDVVFIAGGGPIGVLVHLLARLAGAGRIIVSDLHPERLASARAFGADIAVDAGREDPVAVAHEATGGSGVDVAIEAVGAGVTARQTIDAVRNAGTVVWLGNSERRIEIDMQAVVTRDLVVRGSYGMTVQEFERALTLLATGRLPVDAIVNRYASLSEGPELFEELLAAPATIKCVIRP